MAITYIAFIECVLTPKEYWHTVNFNNYKSYSRIDRIHKVDTENAEVRLVDIKGDRRYFSFKLGGLKTTQRLWI